MGRKPPFTYHKKMGWSVSYFRGSSRLTDGNIFAAQAA